jgi:PEP-CTERM motif-containing protein
MRRARASKLRWAAAGALAAVITWGGPAIADDEATATAEKGTPAVAPVAPASNEDGWLALRADLLRRRELSSQPLVKDRSYPVRFNERRGPKDRIDRIRGRGHKKELETRDVPLETQPILIGYRSTETNGQPPDAPEPTTFALMSVGLASWILFNRRRKG